MKLMLPTTNYRSHPLQRLLIALFSLGLCALLMAPSVLALSDAQQLVVESWRLVNQAYLDPAKFDQVHWRRLREQALAKPINNSDEAYAAIESMLLPLEDPYTRLLRPHDYNAIKATNLGSEINGVGLQLGARAEDGEIVVISPLEGSPAADAGVISGTALISVDGESPKGLGLEATAARLRGEVGTQVVVMLQPPNGSSEEVT